MYLLAWDNSGPSQPGNEIGRRVCCFQVPQRRSYPSFNLESGCLCLQCLYHGEVIVWM